ncbi:chromosome segregation protein SMC [Halalkalibacter sp. APA_J-10(15)]|uniref:chromosome segregation protein SMC n=1 Tax=Halalkalibacter sp. APA_J-10(15) TaxID=2933805 RepID=UPI001FF50551|nr:chromosome segregation protein SMC [Halalkalibacter sp. APA_J-10(15)]MCK0470723.1 chromosome segregation protein SMC [Halalkalibacter sp. APA_J-10(15)]
MFLKRLEVVGFKSFAEKINIDFVPGVTAVVGPNGSGKSNISDSIRWVLGEQSAKSLRGAKMEDIIFAGSDSRKPLNYAEVSLILDNEDQYIAIDYSEVSVTRRVYRSGDSEYFINKQLCRLKDIVDLFLDSGLGKEAYSIIGQGKIEEILSNKPEDRRVIFEEAAGVLKYKTRKVKAEKRLTETQDNLLRVEDILNELESQVEPLKEQASLAKEYLAIKEELKEIDIALMVFEIEQLHENWLLKKEQLATHTEKLQHLNEELIDLEEQRLAIRENLSNMSQRLSNMQDELLHSSEELEKNEGRKEVLKERRKNASQHKEQLEKSIAEKKDQLESTQKKFEEEQKKEQEIRNRLNEFKRNVSEKEQLANRSATDLEDEMDQLKSDYIEVLNEQASIRNEKRYLEEQIDHQKKKQQRLLTENEDIVQVHQKWLKELEEAKQKESITQRELERITDEYRRISSQAEKQELMYQQKESKLYETFQLQQKLQSRADVLEEMQSDFSGFFHGVKEILKERNGKLTGILGAVAELLRVPKQYETAIEIALGGATQHIVVDSEANARKAIQYLKLNRIGRATFLPLPVLKARTIPAAQVQALSEHLGFLGVAASLIRSDERYRPVLEHLLGNVIIAEDLQAANELAKRVGHRFRVVTLEGDVVNTGGSMTGGAVKQKQTPLLGRKRELEDLQNKLSNLKEVADSLEQEVKELKSVSQQLMEKRESLRGSGENIRQEWQEMKSYVTVIERELELTKDQFTRFDREKDSFTNEISQMTERIQTLDSTYDVMVDRGQQLEQRVKTLEQKQKEQKESEETLQEQLTTGKIELARIKEQYQAISSQVDYWGTMKEQFESEYRDLNDQYKDLVLEMSDRTNGEDHINEMISESRLKKQELTVHITSLREEREQQEQLLIEVEQTQKEKQQLQSAVSNECTSIEVKVNRMDVDLDNRLSSIQEEYELSFEAAQQTYQLTIDANEAKTKVRLMKRSIDELGTVNIGAIEEYDRVSERFDFLTTQQNDLQEAKETLHGVITEMDQEMTKRFYDTYVHIRSHFQVIYKKLFGGGEADLVLTEPENLLDTGVEIMARPPGKKMQNLGLLSGGERSLTAIALLFAILRVRPVPFCVLDEVEAALDEANVSRFAQFLKEFSEATQFIVITHRSGTMEEADVLYGVTMEESGVSKLVSVRLEETKELIES